MTRFLAFPALFLAAPLLGFGQAESPSGEVRVSVVLNADGSRTVYEADNANHKSVATTTEADGKLREKIRYELDENGRFLRGEVLGPREQLRFVAKYRYDANNRLAEETHLARDNTVIGKLVYQYDAAGRQVGYSAYDGTGKLLGQTSLPAVSASKHP
jgi:YD repeat-containing protein